MGFDFTQISAPFRMQPGLRKLGPGAMHLTPNAPGSRALREKLAVLTSFWPQALVKVDGFDARPALDALLTCAAREHPSVIERRDDGIVARHLGWTLHGVALEPVAIDARSADLGIGHCLRGLPVEWRVAALLSLAFADDVAVIDGATARVPWLAVCLPSSWAPERQVGRHFTEIHAPVADNATLLAAGEHLARLVAGPDHWERFVWTLTPNPRLHRHPDRQDPATWPADASAQQVVEQTFLRTERQSFMPITGTSQALFTIHVEVAPLLDAIDGVDPRDGAPLAQRVQTSLASMSEAVLTYRGLTDARDRLLEGLRRFQPKAPRGEV